MCTYVAVKTAVDEATDAATAAANAKTPEEDEDGVSVYKCSV